MSRKAIILVVPIDGEAVTSIWDVTHHIPVEYLQRASLVGIIDPDDSTKVNIVKDRYSPITGEATLSTSLQDHFKQVKKYKKKRRIIDEH